MRRVAWPALLAVVACGDNVAGSGEPRSGARLRIAHYVYDDGTRQPETAWFYDADRDERCAERRWSDGNAYCTPAAGDTVYTSADCTTLLGRIATRGALPAERPRYAARPYWIDGRWRPSRLFVLGEQTTPPAQVWELRDGVCYGPTPADGSDYHDLAAEVPREQLVRLRELDDVSQARLVLRVVTSEDGLRAPVAVHDRELGVDCELAAPDEERATCVPRDIATTSYFHDAACTQPELAIPQGVVRPAVVRHLNETGCATYYEVGAQVHAPPLYSGVPDACTEIVPPQSDRFFVVGPPVGLPTLARVRAATAGRRVQPVMLVAGALRTPDSLLFDGTLGVDCRRVETDDDHRCIPATTHPITYLFADDACQTVTPLALVDPRACGVVPRFARARSTDTGDDTVEVRALIAPRSLPLYHLSTGERCLPYTTPAPLVAYDLGPVIPLALFPGAELVVEP